jgi:hypothetical protein
VYFAAVKRLYKQLCRSRNECDFTATENKRQFNSRKTANVTKNKINGVVNN